jgi:3-methyladenine DNA glycosylase AlkD
MSIVQNSVLKNNEDSEAPMLTPVRTPIAATESAPLSCSEVVRKIVTVLPDALLSPHSRLNLQDFRQRVRMQRLAFRSGARQLSTNSAARGIAPAPNQQGALVVRKMKESNRPAEEPVPAGVPALAEEIDDRLSNLAGATTAELRDVRREFTHRLKDAAPHVVIELANLLIDVPQIAYRFIAYELIHHHPPALSHLNAWQLEQLGRGIASWGAVDCFAVFLAGPVWRDRRVPNSLIHGWAHSADRWWRRAAVVSTVPLNSKAQGGTGDTYRTLQVCRLLERDRDPMVAKAMSWALRELAKRDPRAVRDYLAARKEVLPAIVLREVTNKLKTGVKNPKQKAAAAK